MLHPFIYWLKSSGGFLLIFKLFTKGIRRQEIRSFFNDQVRSAAVRSLMANQLMVIDLA